MKHKKFITHRLWLVVGCSFVAALLLVMLVQAPGGVLFPSDDGLALAQTGPPPPDDDDDDDDDDGGFPPGPPPGVQSCPAVIGPPPGTPRVDVSFPAVPPAGIPPVVGNGALALIPPATNGAVAVVEITTQPGHTFIAIVPADPVKELVLRIQELEQVDLPAPLEPDNIPGFPPTSNILGIEVVFEMDLYDATTGEEISAHAPILIGGFCFNTDFTPNTPVLFRFDAIATFYRIPVQIYFPASRTLRADLPETSVFAVAIVSGRASSIAAIPTPVIPAGLPRTGGDTVNGGVVAMIATIFAILAPAAGLALWRHRAARLQQ